MGISALRVYTLRVMLSVLILQLPFVQALKVLEVCITNTIPKASESLQFTSAEGIWKNVTPN